MLVKERCSCPSHEAVGVLGRCGSLWPSFMALHGPVDSKAQRVSPPEAEDEAPEIVADLA